MEWGQGRYERVAAQLLPAAEVVVERAAIDPAERVVDVGCGTGNAALLAAERGAPVTGVDPAQRLLDVAAAEASERGLDASFVVGEAASIPLPDASADVVLSVFGAIFAPDPRAAADEMVRVLAPEGRLLLAAWIPEGAISRAVRLNRQDSLGDPRAATRRAAVSVARGRRPERAVRAARSRSRNRRARDLLYGLVRAGVRRQRVREPSARGRRATGHREGRPSRRGTSTAPGYLQGGQRGPVGLPGDQPLRRRGDGAGQAVAGHDAVASRAQIRRSRRTI